MIDFSEFTIEKLCRWYVIHSYIYYAYDTSVIIDNDFDTICNLILSKICNGEKIPIYFKDLVDKDSLEAGTGFHIRFAELSNRIKIIAHTLATGVGIDGKKINLKEWLR